MRSVLHVGAGGNPLPSYFGEVAETRLDIDPQHKPDVVASMTDMGPIGGFDLLYCSHALEHLWPWDVGTALREFRRVLKPGGAAIVIVPDLEDVKPTEDVLFVAPYGPITGLDMIYGHSDLVRLNPHMAHRCGFVVETMREAFEAAGFAQAKVARAGDYNLLGVGVKAA